MAEGGTTELVPLNQQGKKACIHIRVGPATICSWAFGATPGDQAWAGLAGEVTGPTVRMMGEHGHSMLQTGGKRDGCNIIAITDWRVRRRNGRLVKVRSISRGRVMAAVMRMLRSTQDTLQVSTQSNASSSPRMCWHLDYSEKKSWTTRGSVRSSTFGHLIGSLPEEDTLSFPFPPFPSCEHNSDMH